MKHLFIAFISLSFLSPAKSQEDDSRQKTRDYFNNFQNYLYDNPNADSAYYFAELLASNGKNLNILRDLLQENFAQEFIHYASGDTSGKYRQVSSRKLLAKLATDTSSLIHTIIKPVYLWETVQENADNPAVLDSLATAFYATQLSRDDIYDNKTGRYGLLIYQVISRHPALQTIAEKIFNTVYTSLKQGQVAVTDSSARVVMRKRAWYRYLFAYVNYVRAGQTNDAAQQLRLLKTAYEYSPDLKDRNVGSAYFYDMIFLFGGEQKPSFTADYLGQLTRASADQADVLKTLRSIALVDPEYKTQLRSYYESKAGNSKSFANFWNEAVNAIAKPAPPLQFTSMEKKSFSTAKLKGKWILLDFWGTWCGPCREEHPDLQLFYDSTVLANTHKFELMTVACRDTEAAVRAYMKDKHFSFPVTLSDGKIEKTCRVQSYPTKLLFTPQGKWLVVPFGIDWVNFVKEYCSL